MNKLLTEQTEVLLNTLQGRIEKNSPIHLSVNWTKLKAKLMANPDKLWSLHQMEITGGEPNLVAYHEKADTYQFFDCVAESPKGRRSICYDADALAARKEHKPGNSALNMANEMGIEILTEEQYRQLQQLGKFDTKTSSWIKTPPEIRELGGALFCDFRYEKVFVYHNGAESYYGARGFRGSLTV